MFGRCVDAFVEEGYIVGVHGVSVHAAIREAGESKAEAEGVGGQAFIAFGKAFEQCAELDVNFRGALDASPDGIEGFREGCWEAVFKVGRECFVGEFFCDGDRGLFTPYGELLMLRD